MSAEHWGAEFAAANCAFSQGDGERRDSGGAETGVGMVELVIYVVADLGVGVEPVAEGGVKGAKGTRVLGDSSGRGGRVGWSC